MKGESNIKYCPKCGRQLNDEAYLPTVCKSVQNKSTFEGKDTNNFVWILLGFLEPIVGLVLYSIWDEDYPTRARSFGKGALIGFITKTLLVVFF